MVWDSTDYSCMTLKLPVDRDVYIDAKEYAESPVALPDYINLSAYASNHGYHVTTGAPLKPFFEAATLRPVITPESKPQITKFVIGAGEENTELAIAKEELKANPKMANKRMVYDLARQDPDRYIVNMCEAQGRMAVDDHRLYEAMLMNKRTAHQSHTSRLIKEGFVIGTKFISNVSLDTGSQLNLVSWQLMHDLSIICPEWENAVAAEYLMPKIKHLTSVSGQRISIMGHITLPVIHNGYRENVRFAVMDLKADELILGIPGMQAIGYKLIHETSPDRCLLFQTTYPQWDGHDVASSREKTQTNIRDSVSYYNRNKYPLYYDTIVRSEPLTPQERARQSIKKPAEEIQEFNERAERMMYLYQPDDESEYKGETPLFLPRNFNDCELSDGPYSYESWATAQAYFRGLVDECPNRYAKYSAATIDIERANKEAVDHELAKAHAANSGPRFSSMPKEPAMVSATKEEPENPWEDFNREALEKEMLDDMNEPKTPNSTGTQVSKTKKSRRNRKAKHCNRESGDCHQ